MCVLKPSNTHHANILDLISQILDDRASSEDQDLLGEEFEGLQQ